MAVIKANAYGHGMLEVARQVSAQVRFFAVSSLREALELKEHGLKNPVLILARLLGDELPLAVSEGFTLSVSSLEEAEEISAAAMALGKVTAVHVKIDTGMGRFGIRAENALKHIEKMNSLACLNMEGLFTHFPAAERTDAFFENQVRAFMGIQSALEEKGIVFRFRHSANSAATLQIRSPLFNIIRPGLMLYGIYPDPSLRNLMAVHPVLSLKSRIIFLKHLRAGETAGYGRHFIAPQATTLAIVAMGYSHGYPFRAAAQAHVLYRGAPVPLAGRISMDYMTLNLGNRPARIGDEVTLIGEDHEERITAEQLADWAGTIPYEIVTGLAPSLPRFYR